MPKSPPEPSHYDRIYLSPHLDDAALSCGGRILEDHMAGRSSLVVTIATAEPPPECVSDFAQSQHDHWRLETGSVVESRRREERAACEQLGADLLFLDELECIYRTHPVTGEALYGSTEALFGDIPEADRAMVAVLARHFLALPSAGEVYAPLGAGGHVDHRLARWAAEMCFGSELRYYEDYPYVQLADVLGGALGDEAAWRSEVVPLSERALSGKVDAIRCYTSQLQPLFSSRAEVESFVGAYVTQVGGERIWTRR